MNILFSIQQQCDLGRLLISHVSFFEDVISSNKTSLRSMLSGDAVPLLVTTGSPRHTGVSEGSLVCTPHQIITL